ncbi:hypothetical protein Tco_0291858 [Tanacetum coccineum]
MDPNSSIGRLCLGKDDQVSLNDGIESTGEWDTPNQCNTTNGKGKKELKEFTYYRMETEEKSERYITPCFINGLEVYDGEINLKNDKNLISNSLAVRLCLRFKEKKETRDDTVPGIVLGRSFLKKTRGIVDFGKGIVTIYPDNDSFHDDTDNSDNSKDDWGAILEVIDFGDIQEIDGLELPSLCSRPIIETLKYSDQHKKLLDSVLMDKLKLDEEVEEYEEEAAKEKKMVAFLGSLSVSLQHNEWMPSCDDNSTRKVESDGVWHLKCSIVDPYGNEYNHGYQTKATDMELSKFYKLSDIMSPDWF